MFYYLLHFSAFLDLHQHNYIPNAKYATLDLCFSNALKVWVARSNRQLDTKDGYHLPLEVAISVANDLRRVKFVETNTLYNYALWDYKGLFNYFLTSTGPSFCKVSMSIIKYLHSQI